MLDDRSVRETCMVHTHVPRQLRIDGADIEFVPMHSGECVSGADEAQSLPEYPTSQIMNFIMLISRERSAENGSVILKQTLQFTMVGLALFLHKRQS